MQRRAGFPEEPGQLSAWRPRRRRREGRRLLFVSSDLPLEIFRTYLRKTHVRPGVHGPALSLLAWKAVVVTSLGARFLPPGP